MDNADVFIAQHEYEDEDEVEHVKLIGIYTTKEKAEAAVERLKEMPGFNQHPDGFYVGGLRFDHTSWISGFFRIWPDGRTMD